MKCTGHVRVFPGRYVDSVVLMRLARDLAARPEIADAAAVMATDANKALLAQGGFDGNGAVPAGPDDLLVAVKSANPVRATAALDEVDALLASPRAGDGVTTVHTLEEALERQPHTNLVAITLPGEYAAAEARKALERDVHVFIFSSNVPLADEIELKTLAAERGLLCMGPDCGTAIVGGVGLGFANAVRRGKVGVVGAAGTGLQAVTSLLHRLGAGISNAIGTGSRDVTDAVGGLTMLAGLQALVDDPLTEAIVMVAKPPDPETAARLHSAAHAAPKPVVCCFLGEPGGGRMTLDAAALAAAAAVGVNPSPFADALAPELVAELRARHAPGQRWIRGLFAGGTLAYEAQLLLRDARLDVASNSPLTGGRTLSDAHRSEGHTIVDLGSEEFTRGRPHPMIDARERRLRLAVEADDPETAVILLDVVLGYGAAVDPAGDLAEAIAAGRDRAARSARQLAVVASVCGTENDPQGLTAQEQVLREAGVVVLPTSAAAARTAAALVGGSTR
jgi:FdrA protein